MTKAETAKLLAMAAAFDQRTVGAEDVEAWHLVVGDLSAADAVQAVAEHYRTETRRILPADVRKAVRRIHRQRLDTAPPLDPPADLDPDDELAYRRWLASTRRAIAEGRTPPQAPELPARDMRAIEGTFREVGDA